GNLNFGGGGGRGRDEGGAGGGRSGDRAGGRGGGMAGATGRVWWRGTGEGSVDGMVAGAGAAAGMGGEGGGGMAGASGWGQEQRRERGGGFRIVDKSGGPPWAVRGVVAARRWGWVALVADRGGAGRGGVGRGGSSPWRLAVVAGVVHGGGSGRSCRGGRPRVAVIVGWRWGGRQWQRGWGRPCRGGRPRGPLWTVRVWGCNFCLFYKGSLTVDNFVQDGVIWHGSVLVRFGIIQNKDSGYGIWECNKVYVIDKGFRISSNSFW
nr:hypothetical protein [Tanacetum cinerariifolium]